MAAAGGVAAERDLLSATSLQDGEGSPLFLFETLDAPPQLFVEAFRICSARIVRPQPIVLLALEALLLPAGISRS